MPARVVDIVQRFEERRFALMSFAHACGNAGLELLESNPALGFMVATNWIWHKPSVKRPMDAARRLAGMRRRKILEWLQFAIPSDAAVGVLAECPPELLSVESLFYLRDAMRRPEILRILGFLHKINRGVIRIVSDPQLVPHVTHNLFKEIAMNPNDDQSAQTAYWLRENLLMMRRLERDPRRLRFQTIRRIHEVHQQLSRESARIVVATLAFPSPPLPGTDGIEPIETPGELVREAEEQNNCVMSLAKDIAEGRLFLYRMLQPERVTISIVPHGEAWVVQECLGPSNEPVSPASMAAIYWWLAFSQGKTLPEIHSKRNGANPNALLDAHYPDEVEEWTMWRR